MSLIARIAVATLAILWVLWGQDWRTLAEVFRKLSPWYFGLSLVVYRDSPGDYCRPMVAAAAGPVDSHRGVGGRAAVLPGAFLQQRDAGGRWRRPAQGLVRHKTYGQKACGGAERLRGSGCRAGRDAADSDLHVPDICAGANRDRRCGGGVDFAALGGDFMGGSGGWGRVRGSAGASGGPGKDWLGSRQRFGSRAFCCCGGSKTLSWCIAPGPGPCCWRWS